MTSRSRWGGLRVPGHPGPVLPHPTRRLNFGDRQQGWNTAVSRAAAETHSRTAESRRWRAAPRTEAVRGGRGRKCLRRTFRRAGRRAEIQRRATPALSPPKPAGPAPRPPQDTYGLAGCLCWGPRARTLHPAALEAACGRGAPDLQRPARAGRAARPHGVTSAAASPSRRYLTPSDPGIPARANHLGALALAPPRL